MHMPLLLVWLSVLASWVMARPMGGDSDDDSELWEATEPAQAGRLVFQYSDRSPDMILDVVGRDHTVGFSRKDVFTSPTVTLRTNQASSSRLVLWDFGLKIFGNIGIQVKPLISENSPGYSPVAYRPLQGYACSNKRDKMNEGFVKDKWFYNKQTGIIRPSFFQNGTTIFPRIATNVLRDGRFGLLAITNVTNAARDLPNAKYGDLKFIPEYATRSYSETYEAVQEQAEEQPAASSKGTQQTKKKTKTPTAVKKQS